MVVVCECVCVCVRMFWGGGGGGVVRRILRCADGCLGLVAAGLPSAVRVLRSEVGRRRRRRCGWLVVLWVGVLVVCARRRRCGPEVCPLACLAGAATCACCWQGSCFQRPNPPPLLSRHTAWHAHMFIL